MLFRRARHRMRCRTATRGRDVLDVTPGVDRRGPVVVVRLNDADAPRTLTPQEVGRLRGRLRDAVLHAVQLAEQVKRDRGRA
jgi:hypothetical protein